MKGRAGIVALSVSLMLCLPSVGPGQSKSHEHLGTVEFPNSCSAAVQDSLRRGVALLHSLWFDEGERAFRTALAQDPACAVATWGIAAVLMRDPLGGDGPSPQSAQRAQAAIDQGRRIRAQTLRERDYIEAIAAYYGDWANRWEGARQQSRARAFESLAARYPNDAEAQIFYALYVASTQSPADQTYASYLKAAAILEPLFVQHPVPSIYSSDLVTPPAAGIRDGARRRVAPPPPCPGSAAVHSEAQVSL